MLQQKSVKLERKQHNIARVLKVIRFSAKGRATEGRAGKEGNEEPQGRNSGGEQSSGTNSTE